MRNFKVVFFKEGIRKESFVETHSKAQAAALVLRDELNNKVGKPNSLIDYNCIWYVIDSSEFDIECGK